MWFLIKGTFLLSTLVLFSAIGIVQYLNYKSNLEVQRLEEWSLKNKLKIGKTKMVSQPFKIEYDEAEWNLLKQKLDLTKYFQRLSDVPINDYGFDPEYAKELVDYWRTKYDWKAQVEYLNRYPQFRIVINDTTLHYVHFVTNKENKNLKRVPLLILDGWPGSFFGFYKMLDYLNENFKDVSYDIIIPSIPGYGYSSPVNKVVDAFDTAIFYDAIMRYEHGDDVEYYIHGEDWGSVLTTLLAKLFPNRVKGIHITMPPLTSFFDPVSMFYALWGQFCPNCILTPEEIKHNFKYSLSEIFWLIVKKTGYFHMQATKPDTLGAGLTDSPVGLMAYILEKYSIGSFGNNQVLGKKDGNLDKFDRDELLTIITFYWMTNTITSSMRLYRHTFYTASLGWPRSSINMNKISAKVPVAVQYFKYEVSTVPYSILRQKYLNLTRFNIVETGGHFAGFESPKQSADDFIAFIRSI